MCLLRLFFVFSFSFSLSSSWCRYESGDLRRSTRARMRIQVGRSERVADMTCWTLLCVLRRHTPMWLTLLLTLLLLSPPLLPSSSQPRMKVSSDHDKVTIPGGKEAYRLYNSASEPVIDLLVQVGTSAPQPNKRILCRHPFDANRRVYVTPHMVHPLHHLVWDGPVHCHHSNPLEGYPSLAEIREYVATELKRFREDHLRRLNPTPYKIAVSSDLFAFMQDLWLQETPIAEII